MLSHFALVMLKVNQSKPPYTNSNPPDVIVITVQQRRIFMKPISKPAVMARLYIEDKRHVSSLIVGVNFSIVSSADGVSVPNFVSFGFDTPKSLVGYSDLAVSSYLSSDDYPDKGIAGIYGYNLKLGMNSPDFDTPLTNAYKAGNRINSKLAKLSNDEGVPGDFAGYLAHLFRVMNVQYITFEHYSEVKYHQKWKGYKIADLPFLLTKASELGATLKRWPIKEAA